MELKSHNSNEMAKITELAFITKRHNILEIGSYLFELTAFFLGIAVKKVVAVDIKCHDEKKLHLLHTLYSERFKFIFNDSKDPKAVEDVKHYLGNQTFDIIFIDGDHSLNGVDADTKNYADFIDRHGFIFWHDAAKRVWSYIYDLKDKGIPIKLYLDGIDIEHSRGLAYIAGEDWLRYRKFLR